MLSEPVIAAGRPVDCVQKRSEWPDLPWLGATDSPGHRQLNLPVDGETRWAGSGPDTMPLWVASQPQSACCIQGTPLAPQFPADPGEYRSHCLGHMRLMGSGPRPQGSTRSQEKELKPRLPSCGAAGNVGLSWGQLRGLGGGGGDNPCFFKYLKS